MEEKNIKQLIEEEYPSFQEIRNEGAEQAKELKSYVDRVIAREFFEFGAKYVLNKCQESENKKVKQLEEKLQAKIRQKLEYERMYWEAMQKLYDAGIERPAIVPSHRG